MSVNEGTPKCYRTTKYKDFTDAVQLLQVIGPEAKLAKSDLTAAFRQTPIRPEDWHLLVFKARDPATGKEWYFFDKCLPFGHCESCQIYQRVSNALAWATEKITQRELVNYLDDFFSRIEQQTFATGR